MTCHLASCLYTSPQNYPLDMSRGKPSEEFHIEWDILYFKPSYWMGLTVSETVILDGVYCIWNRHIGWDTVYLKPSNWMRYSVFEIVILDGIFETVFISTMDVCKDLWYRGHIKLPVNSPQELWFFYLRLNKRLSKQSRCRWFETPSR